MNISTPQSRAPASAGQSDSSHLANRQFVFLICSERCGSNLISKIMGCNSNVTAPPPYHLCRDVGLNLHATLGTSASSQTWLQLKNLMVSRVLKFKSREAAMQLAQWFNTHEHISFCDIAHFVFSGLNGANAPGTVFIKENNLHEMLFFILQCFPNAKFVFQVRDPRDYLVSAKSLRKQRFGNKFGSNRHAMEVWRKDQLGGLQAMAHLGPERVFFQRYEDLIGNPEAVLIALCAFLGLDFEPHMLDFHQSADAARLAQQGGPWANLNKPLIAGNSGQYRQKLSTNEIKMVETYVGDLMERFGYRQDFPDNKGLFHVFWPQILEPLERYFNGDKRPFYASGFSATMESAGTPLATTYTQITGQTPSNGS